MRALLCLCAVALLTGCGGTSWKVAPTTAKVATKLATARRTVQHQRETATTLETDTKRTQAEAGKSIIFIDAALNAILRRDYDDAVRQLTSARASVGLIKEQLDAALHNVDSLKTAIDTEDHDLVAAEEESKRVDTAIETMAIQGAKDRAIVEEVNWGFLGVHIGALFYFFKSLLRLGFIGIVVLVVLGIVLAILAATLGGPFLAGLQWLWGRFKKRT